MAKLPSSVLGLDLGRYSFKAVHLARKSGNRFVLQNYALRHIDGAVESPEGLAREIRSLIGEVGGPAKTCAIAVSSSDALLRIIEQPETPTDLLRDAVRLNGMSLLNQDVRNFVLDCALIQEGGTSPQEGNKRKYLVAGLPREQVVQLDEAFQKSKVGVKALQLAPVCSLNALEFAEPETFNDQAFMLVDIGHYGSTVTVGVKREIILGRAIDFGGQALIETLVSHGGKANAAEALLALEQGDEVMTEVARLALTALTREISSSIGFFEARREENIRRILVSGGPASSKALLAILNEELHIACEVWNPFKNCQISVPGDRSKSLSRDMANLHVACGAAAELLQGK
jgi:type IV pilus assembly protein PilM